ncbi:unnamed protein product, partial [Boreogadus saida]
MTAYLSKQQSCYADLDDEGRGGRGGYGEEEAYWTQRRQRPQHHQHHHQQQPHQLPRQHSHQHPSHQSLQRYQHGAGVPGGATLPKRWGRTGQGGEPKGLLSYRSASAKGRSCDQWAAECGCVQGWQEPYQVNGLSPPGGPRLGMGGPISRPTWTQGPGLSAG